MPNRSRLASTTNKVERFGAVNRAAIASRTLPARQDHSAQRPCCGDEFRERNALKLPKVVLLDLKIPKLDGLQVLEAIKGHAATRDILVAMVSARGQVTDHDAARVRGADAYFVKPFSPLQLVNWVHDKLEKPGP